MNKNLETTAQDEQGFHLPLEPFFTLLRTKGFQVKPDDYIEMLKVVERFGSADFDETVKWICPILATSETEQARFYGVAQEYKNLYAGTGSTQVRKPFPLWLKIALPAAVFLLVLFLYYHSHRPAKEPLVILPVDGQVIKKGDTLLLDATPVFEGRQEDTGKVAVRWQVDGVEKKGIRSSHVFNHPGQYIVARNFESDEVPLQKKKDSIRVVVCDDFHPVAIQVPDGNIITKQETVFSAVIGNYTGSGVSYQWRINDSIQSETSSTFRHAFNAAGDYRIECRALTGSLNDPCMQAGVRMLHVDDPGLTYFIRTGEGSRFHPVNLELKPWITLLLLVPACAGLLYSLLKRNKKRRDQKTEERPAPEKDQPPFQIPFEQTDLKRIRQEKEWRRVLLHMRHRVEEDTLVLHIPATIYSTVRSGGLPELVYTPATRKQQYLILIDRTNPKGLLTQLFGYLANSMAEDGIPLERFSYDRQLKCYNESFPSGIPLQKLAETHSDSTLLLFGKAHELVYRAYPLIEESLYRELARWENKAIITPVCHADWGEKEKVLARHFLLLPADLHGLQQLMLSGEKTRKKPEPGASADVRSSTAYVDFDEADEIREFLQDEVLFQWLCAICIYPKLRWEVLVEIGKVVLDRYNAAEKLTYSTLLKLCRISWMQDGVIPQHTRLELLKRLETGNEVAARETLLRMFAYADALYGKDAFFQHEKKRQQLTNEFILYAHDRQRFARYEESAQLFKKLWEANAILDAPLGKYLDKKEGDSWDTPLNSGAKSVGIRDYFHLQDIKLNRSVRTRRIIAAACSVFLIGCWIYLGFWGGAVEISSKLIQLQTSQLVRIDLEVNKDFTECGDSSAVFDTLSGYLKIEDRQYPLSYLQHASYARFNIPYQELLKGKSTLLLNWDNDKHVEKNIQLSLNRFDTIAVRFPYSVTVLCKNVLPVNTDRQYKDSMIRSANYRKLLQTPFAKILTGCWSGSGSQENGSTWTLRLVCNVEKEEFLVEYPSFGCSGKWDIEQVNDKGIYFAERILKGTGSCAGSAKLHMDFISNTKLKLSYYSPEGVTSTAEISKGCNSISAADTAGNVPEAAADSFQVVERAFTPSSFSDYVSTLNFDTWHPSLIVLHNTGVPFSVAKMPDGLTKKDLDGLYRTFRDVNKWKSGPHLFIDQHAIWVFNPLTKRGIHSPSWNKVALGIMMLGDYNNEPVDPNVLRNTIQAIAILCRTLKIDPGTVKLHSEDPISQSICPGKNVHKDEIIKAVRDLLNPQKASAY